jgi:hypothetical protein
MRANDMSENIHQISWSGAQSSGETAWKLVTPIGGLDG